MKLATHFLMASAAAALVAGAANAATTVTSVSWPSQTTDLTGTQSTDSNAVTANNPNGLTSLSLFDSTLGTLTGITIDYAYNINSTIVVTNNSGSTSNGSIRAESGSKFSATSATNGADISSLLNQYVNTALNADDQNSVSFGNQTLTPIAFDIRGASGPNNASGSYSLQNGQQTTIVSTGSKSKSISISSLSDLLAFEAAGGGTFNALLSTLTGITGSSNGGNSNMNQNTQAGGSMQITYTYTAAVAAVPEPATWGMMVLGFGAMGVAMRRRQKASVSFQ